ncbi:hypothetical protein D9M68_839840 [compost metagenome]
MVALVEHRQAHGDREDDGGAAHETGDQRHHQGFLAGGQGGGELVAAHVGGDDHGRRQGRVRTEGIEEGAEDALDGDGQVGDGGHDAGRGHEDVAGGMDAFHELLAEAFVAVADGGQRAEYRAGHDEVEHVIAELVHLEVLFLVLRDVLDGKRPSGRAAQANGMGSAGDCRAGG